MRFRRLALVAALIGASVIGATIPAQAAGPEIRRRVYIQNESASGLWNLSKAVNAWNNAPNSRIWLQFGPCPANNKPYTGYGYDCYRIREQYIGGSSASKTLATTFIETSSQGGWVTLFIYDDTRNQTTAMINKRDFTVLHEFGHAAGYPGHLASTCGCIMQPTYKSSITPTPKPIDVSAVNVYWINNG